MTVTTDCRSEFCTEADPCFDCAERRIDEKIEAGIYDDEVERALRLRSVQISPAATPTKERKLAKTPGARGGNSWEKGVALDHRGLPYLDGMNPIPVKKFSENRHVYEGKIRQLHQTGSIT